MIEELRKNLDMEIDLVNELAGVMTKLEQSTESEKKLLVDMSSSLRSRIKILNDSLPALIAKVPIARPLKVNERPTGIEKISVDDSKQIYLSKSSKEAFFKELDINRYLIKRLKKRKATADERIIDYKVPNFYGKISNSLFLDTSEKWLARGEFKSLSLDLRKSNMDILAATYISMMILTTFISVLVGAVILAGFIFLDASLAFPYFSVNEGGYFMRLVKFFWIIFTVPLLTAFSFYFYPTTEKKSISRRIDQELPFVVIHMASIAGSGIEPVQIFTIIGLSKDYKNTGKEIRKVLNQINVYGYDLTTALRNIALSTPSSRLSEMLNGISVTINSGGDMKSFFEKRAESLLLDYRLEREKFTKTAETFMDIYISIVITAPMILLMLLILISISGISFGLSVAEMTIAIIGIVAMINVLFLTFLNFKQPGY